MWKKRHFINVCKSAVSEVREVVAPELAVLCVDDVQLLAAFNDKITCTVNVEVPQGNSHILEQTVDTGASASILSEKMYRQYFANCSLREPKVKLVTHSRGKLLVIVCLPAVASTARQQSFSLLLHC